MRWEAWVLIAALCVGALRDVWYTGRQKPINGPAMVCGGLFEMAFYVWLVLRLAGVA